MNENQSFKCYGYVIQNCAAAPPGSSGLNNGVLDPQQYVFDSTSSFLQGRADDEAPTRSRACAPGQSVEGTFGKEQIRLLKNRQAVKRYRHRKNDYIRRLESRMVELENQNRSLMKELEDMKLILRAKTM